MKATHLREITIYLPNHLHFCPLKASYSHLTGGLTAEFVENASSTKLYICHRTILKKKLEWSSFAIRAGNLKHEKRSILSIMD